MAIGILGVYLDYPTRSLIYLLQFKNKTNIKQLVNIDSMDVDGGYQKLTNCTKNLGNHNKPQDSEIPRRSVKQSNHLRVNYHE
ncbi:hypothetical protein ACOMICROBIO_EPCKBFOG_03426 [Vibrio sp. B1FLJ16]|nr:hypothetical protein ACOMICROBIO_EPCKBFOG_03426 [Vibrio sp. B1FLJ16]CAE6935527.1 hypothetical protein ACOMICROBIO_EPCKBFOG_03426 [Vibrio sp. B1FLJ16]